MNFLSLIFVCKICVFLSRPMKIVTFLKKNGETPKRVVDFRLERDKLRNTIMEIVEDFDEKSYNNNGKPWKSSGILSVKPKFFIFSMFVMFFVFSFPFFSFFFNFQHVLHFFIFHFLFFLHFSFFFIFLHFLSCSFSFFFSFSFLIFLVFSFVFPSFFFFLSGAQNLFVFFLASISLRFLMTFLSQKFNVSARLGR